VEPDIDLRKVRYFLAVAERLHFGQAAEALHITQPALSRQIQQLERDLGVDLFARSSREVALTPAGEQFVDFSRQLLALTQTALETVRRTAAGNDAFRVGFMLGMDIEATLRAFTASRPGISVLLERLRWWGHGEVIRSGHVDAGFVRLPIAEDGLELLPLYTEPLNVALPSNHPLATRTELAIADLTAEPVLRYADAIPAWNAFWCADPRPDGTQAHPGPAVHDMEEIVEYVRTGRGVAFLPQAVCAMFPRPGITYVPVPDIPPGQVALAWPANRRTPLVNALAQVAHRTLGQANGEY
jgi:DNA-binding transcriptional LysR family regulator